MSPLLCLYSSARCLSLLAYRHPSEASSLDLPDLEFSDEFTTQLHNPSTHLHAVESKFFDVKESYEAGLHQSVSWIRDTHILQMSTSQGKFFAASGQARLEMASHCTKLLLTRLRVRLQRMSTCEWGRSNSCFRRALS